MLVNICLHPCWLPYMQSIIFIAANFFVHLLLIPNIHLTFFLSKEIFFWLFKLFLLAACSLRKNISFTVTFFIMQLASLFVLLYKKKGYAIFSSHFPLNSEMRSQYGPVDLNSEPYMSTSCHLSFEVVQIYNPSYPYTAPVSHHHCDINIISLVL